MRPTAVRLHGKRMGPRPQAECKDPGTAPYTRFVAAQLKAEERTGKARLHSPRYVRPLLSLVGDTSPPLVVASISLRLVRALMPLAMLWVPKLIIDAVVAWVSHRSGSVAHIWDQGAIECGLAWVSDVLSRSNSLCNSLLGDRFTNRVSVRLMQHATVL